MPKDRNSSLSYTHTNLSGKLFGALKDFGSRLVLLPVVEGISAMHSIKPLSFSAGTDDAELAQEASSLLSFSALDRDDLMNDSIPVVKLEPGEIAEICISIGPTDRQSRSNTDPSRYGQQNVLLTCLSEAACDSKYQSLSLTSANIATTRSDESAVQDDIVFSSSAKRKIKKLIKTAG